MKALKFVIFERNYPTKISCSFMPNNLEAFAINHFHQATHSFLVTHTILEASVACARQVKCNASYQRPTPN